MNDASKSSTGQGWFARLKAGLARSSSRLVGGISDLFAKKKLDEATLAGLEDLLISADLGAATATTLVQDLAKTRFGKDITEAEVRETFAAAKIEAEIEVYADSAHGWCPPDSRVYNEPLAEKAWTRLLALYGKL